MSERKWMVPAMPVTYKGTVRKGRRECPLPGAVSGGRGAEDFKTYPSII